MKRLSSYLLLAVLGIATILSSCSSDNDDVFSYVSDNQMMVVALNPGQILQNAGFELTADGVKAPESLEAAFKKLNVGQAIEICTKIQGVDPKFALGIVNSADGKNKQNGCAMMRITDEGKFVKSLADLGMTVSEEKGYTMYTDEENRITVLINNNIAFFTSQTGTAAVEYIEQLKEEAKKTPCAQWKKEKLSSSNAMSLLISFERYFDAVGSGSEAGIIAALMKGCVDGDLSNGYSYTTIKLDGNKLESEGCMLSANGQELKLNLKSKIDTSMLKYVSANDQAVLMTSIFSDLPWEEIIKQVMGGNDMAQSQQVIDALKSINGTLLLTGGIDNFMNINTDPSSGWHALFAAQMEKGKADQLSGVLQALLTMGHMQGTKEGNAQVYRAPGMPTIYIQVDDNTLVVSVNTSIPNGGSSFSASSFKGKLFAMAFDIPKDNANVTNIPLPFGIKALSVNDDDDHEFDLELTGQSAPLLKQIIDFAASL